MAPEFTRDDTLFSLCGLNCSLCPMFVRGDCVGCRAGSWCAQGCRFVPCSLEHGGVEHCFACPEYPCHRYDGVELRDSLISHRNQKIDMEKARRMGIEAYRFEQRQKASLLHRLLDGFDDGDRDVFFCLAANMLEVGDLADVVERAEKDLPTLPLEDRADRVEDMLRDVAHRRGVPLELRTWAGPW